MSYFEANLELLRKASEHAAVQLEAYHDKHGEPTTLGPFSVEPARDGNLTVRYEEDDKSFYIHSPYNPAKEAEQFAERALRDKNGNFVIFFGCGLGYSAKRVIEQLDKNDTVMVFEPHWELYYLAFCHTDLSWLLTRERTSVTTDASIQGSLLKFMNLQEMAGFRGLVLISNPTFERLPQAETFREFADRVRYEMTAVGGNVQTLMVMGEMQQTNIILNFDQLLSNPPFKHLINKFHGKPTIIVSAGPSLEKNVHLLPELQDKALIIAVDTACRILMENDIKPHIVVTGDPQEANARHLKGIDMPDVYLIAEPQCPISSLRGWTGPKFICTFHDNLMQWVDRVIGDRGRVIVWGSVAVMAYDVAVKIGANPIVFIGQDLSFPGGRTYAKGTYFETEEKQEMTVDRLKKEGTALIEMTDIFGETVFTNRQMYAYFNFLKNRFMHPEVADRTIINATEGGILKSDRVTVMSLSEVKEKFLTDPLAVHDILKAAHQQGNSINFTNLLIELDTLIANLRAALDGCRRGLEAVGKTLTALETAEDSESAAMKSEVVKQYNRVVAIRKSIVRDRAASKIIEMANQTGIYSFARGVKNTKLEDHPDEREEFIKRACYHYHTLYQSTNDAISRLIPPFEAARESTRKYNDRSSHATSS